LILASSIVLAAACGDDSRRTAPTANVATVEIAYLAPTQPTLPPSLDACVRGVGATHVHPSWRNFVAVTMRVAGAERFELVLDDVPVNQRVSIRVSDANACVENPTGAATRNVFANGVRLTDIVTTPGSGPEPGLAFTVAPDGRIQP
jgi:hypothetical protein